MQIFCSVTRGFIPVSSGQCSCVMVVGCSGGPWWDASCLFLSRDSFPASCMWPADHRPLEVAQRSGDKWLVKAWGDVKRASFKPSWYPALSALPAPSSSSSSLSQFMSEVTSCSVHLKACETWLPVGCVLGVMSALWTGHCWLELTHELRGGWKPASRKPKEFQP